MIETKPMTTAEMLETKALRALRAHQEKEAAERRANGVALLVGAQWCVAQIFEPTELIEEPVAKLLGQTDKGEALSGTLEYYEARQFCGIIYYPESVTNKETARQQLRDLAAKHRTPFVFFNPYRNQIRLP